MTEPMITARQVAEMLGVSIYTVYRLKDKPGGLPAYKVARCIRFKPAEVEAYIAAQTVELAAKKDQLPSIRRFKYVPGMKVV